QARRSSWRRCSIKGGSRRKSLPPVHREVTELSKSITKDLPEAERLSELLLASFQFSAQKLEHSLQQSEGFSPEAFRAKVHCLAEDLKSYLQKLTQDGTLKGCVEDPEGGTQPQAGLWHHPQGLPSGVGFLQPCFLHRFTSECQAWDQLLQHYQEGAEDISRQLEECRRREGQAEPQQYLQTSQAEVLSTKPNYQQILDQQGEVLSFMQLVLEELQQAVKLLQAFSHDSHHFLRGLSEQLGKLGAGLQPPWGPVPGVHRGLTGARFALAAARSFQQLESSPVRKLLRAPPRRRPPPEG
ncbi:DSN1 protein, partial [Ramphastos sulfuratus]|nr:DSN1 protein [Ramphastos sulfuratus]